MQRTMHGHTYITYLHAQRRVGRHARSLPTYVCKHGCAQANIYAIQTLMTHYNHSLIEKATCLEGEREGEGERTQRCATAVGV